MYTLINRISARLRDPKFGTSDMSGCKRISGVTALRFHVKLIGFTLHTSTSNYNTQFVSPSCFPDYDHSSVETDR